MIISASYKTDIPAFYGKWLMGRLREGYCRVRNPISGKPFTVSLRRADTDGIVFWTKNPWPFMRELGEIENRGYPFYCQFTITPYDRQVERAVIPPLRAIEAAKRIRREFGPECVVWRYDPIIISSQTSPNWHQEQFQYMAEALQGVSNEVATKFLVLHAKTRRNLEKINFDWFDPPLDEKTQLLKSLSDIAGSYGMKLTVCSQPEIAEELSRSVCLDAERLGRLGAPMGKFKTMGNRPGCLCHAASDIGEYDTCPQGCAYCYATVRQSVAVRRHALHDPLADSLIPLPVQVPKRLTQLRLLDG